MAVEKNAASFNAAAQKAPPEALRLFASATTNDATGVLKLVMDNENATSWKSEEGMTGLMYAAREGSREAAWVLTKATNNIDDQNPNGSTALMFAAFAGKAVIAEMLLQADADVNHVNNNGHTALMSAAAHGFKNTVALLVRYGADVLVKDSEGVAAVEYARDNGYDEIVTILEAAAVDQTARQALAAEEQKKREAAEKDPLLQRIKSIKTEDDNSEAIKRLAQKISQAKLSG